MTFADFKGDEWEMTKGLPVILECLKDNSMIEIIDIDLSTYTSLMPSTQLHDGSSGASHHNP